MFGWDEKSGDGKWGEKWEEKYEFFIVWYVNVSIMLAACQMFGKLPLWVMRLDYLTLGCDNSYIRLWVAFLVVNIC